MTQLELAEKYIVSTNVSVFLTGKAGTGKTTFLRHIVSTLKKRCVVLAPTGVAAVNAEGVTIHSFFQLPLCPYLPDVKELVTEYQLPDKFKQLRKEKQKIIRTLDLIIIDEISMVRADLLDAVDMMLRRYRHSSKPFGGVQLLMIGDVQQLPPVVTDEEKPYMDKVYPSSFFFHSKALQKIHYVTIELTTVYRQQDDRFITLLNNVRDNNIDRSTLDALNSRYDPTFNPDDKEGYIRLTTHNYQADNVNARKLAKLNAKPFVLKASVEGNFLPSSFPTDETLTLKEGAQVMFVRNDSGGHAYYNGKIAIVEGYDPDEGVSVVDKEGNHIVVKQDKWENVKYEIDETDNQIKQKVDGTFTQYPLRLAWAITVHKSQGLTFDKVIIDAASAFTFGQVYVALSRCRSLEGIVLATPLSEKCMFDNQDIIDFNKTIPTIATVRDELGGFQSEYYYDLLYELFNLSQIMHATEKLNSLFQQYLKRLLPGQTHKMSEINNVMVANMVSVAEKFRSQMSKIRISNGGKIDDPYLRDRVVKAVDYFDGQMEQLLLALAPLMEIEISNKVVAADFDEWSSELRDAIGLKQRCLKRVGEQGFSAEVYNQAKVDFLLDKERDGGKKKASYKKRQPKAKKDPTWVETVKLLVEGKSIKDIAEQRNLKYTTITGHLEKALEAGAIDIDMLLTADELDELVDYFLNNAPKNLTEANDHFGGKYQYYKLRAAAYIAKTMN